MSKLRFHQKATSLGMSLFFYLFAASAQASTALQQWCEQVSPRLPTVSVQDCRASSLVASGATSVEGRALMVRDFLPVAKLQKPVSQPLRVLLIGGIHGDEQTAAAVVFKWMARLVKSPSTEIVWRVSPLLNPDGLLANKPKRVNARGVDLNRNFPTPNWEKEATTYWIKKTKRDPRRFPGSAALSEPESRWVYETMQSFNPQLIISVHAPFGVLDLDGPAKPPRRFGRLVYNRVGVYPGSLGNYSGMHQSIPVLTIELPHALKMPKDEEVHRIWLDMQTWIRKHIHRPAKSLPAASK